MEIVFLISLIGLEISVCFILWSFYFCQFLGLCCISICLVRQRQLVKLIYCFWGLVIVSLCVMIFFFFWLSILMSLFRLWVGMIFRCMFRWLVSLVSSLYLKFIGCFWQRKQLVLLQIVMALSMLDFCMFFRFWFIIGNVVLGFIVCICFLGEQVVKSKEDNSVVNISFCMLGFCVKMGWVL